jgi:hypothetical protein
LYRVFLEKIGRQPRDHGSDVFHRQIALTRHHGGVGEHVTVMRDIHVQKTFGRAKDLLVILVCRHCLDIGVDGVQPAASANIDVRRHVHVVSKAGL